MRIRILKNDAFCLAKFENGRYEIGDICVDECCFEHSISNYIKSLGHDDKCITKSVEINEKFFFTIIRYHEKVQQEKCGCVGYLTKDGEKFILNIDDYIDGNKLYPESHHRFLITSYFPTNNFFNERFSRSILTSDGVITLQDDQFIGVRDGLIEELDVQEVLHIIAKGKCETSPLFSSLRLNPVAKRPARPRKGTIIYNKNNNKIELYNGQEWIDL